MKKLIRGIKITIPILVLLLLALCVSPFSDFITNKEIKNLFSQISGFLLHNFYFTFWLLLVLTAVWLVIMWVQRQSKEVGLEEKIKEIMEQNKADNEIINSALRENSTACLNLGNSLDKAHIIIPAKIESWDARSSATVEKLQTKLERQDHWRYQSDKKLYKFVQKASTYIDSELESLISLLDKSRKQ